MNTPRVPMLPIELQQLLQGEIRSGERQLWAAQPLPRLARQQLIFSLVFGGMFTTAGVVWVVVSHVALQSGNGPGWWFQLGGLPFVLVGLPFLTSPLWAKSSAKSTVYAITDRRAIVINGGMFGGIQVYSYEPDRLTSIERNQRADGSGDLVLESFVQGTGSGASTVRRGFMAIANVKEVEDFLHATLLTGRVRAVDGD